MVAQALAAVVEVLPLAEVEAAATDFQVEKETPLVKRAVQQTQERAQSTPTSRITDKTTATEEWAQPPTPWTGWEVERLPA